jgi:hypothetical protein
MKKAIRLKLVLWSGLFVLMAVGTVEIWQSFNQRRWDGLSRFTVMEFDKTRKDIRVLSVDPGTRAAVRMIIPEGMEIMTVGGKGVWKASSVTQLASKFGPVWAGDSVSDFLGIPYTAVAGDMSFWDELAWKILVRGVQWNELNLEDTGWIEESRDPDGAMVLGLNDVGKKKIGEIFYSTGLAKQGLQITVFNTTGVTGLGTRFSRIPENAGFKVIKVGEMDENIRQCQVQSNMHVRENAGVKWLIKNCRCMWKENNQLTDAEVNILVGEDYRVWLDGE